jgi:hypothetical protein
MATKKQKPNKDEIVQTTANILHSVSFLKEQLRILHVNVTQPISELNQVERFVAQLLAKTVA